MNATVPKTSRHVRPRGPGGAIVRIAGRFRVARESIPDGAVERVETESQKDGIEVHMPQIRNT